MTRQTSLRLLPPPKDKCPFCAVGHKPTDPHDAQSLYYQFRFQKAHGRWPTWADAIAHCGQFTAALWKQQLVKLGHWTETPNPIAEPLTSTDGTQCSDSESTPATKPTP